MPPKILAESLEVESLEVESLEEVSTPSNDPAIETAIDISHLVIEDDEPVDNFYSAQQQRFSVQALNEAKILDEPFLVEANVGLFYDIDEDPIVPDVLLSLDVQRGDDYSRKQNRSYFVWELGKLPELCIEIVSNKEGDEVNLSRKSRKKGKTLSKKERYAKIGIQYYVVFDPLEQIRADMGGAMLKVWQLSPEGNYPEASAQSIQAVGDFIWLEDLEIGLTLWYGDFEERTSRVWIRWCDRNGNIYFTGSERLPLVEQIAEEGRMRAKSAENRAETAESRAENAESRAENAESRAENAESRAAQAEAQARLLADRLRALGIDPENL